MDSEASPLGWVSASWTRFRLLTAAELGVALGSLG